MIYHDIDDFAMCPLFRCFLLLMDIFHQRIIQYTLASQFSILLIHRNKMFPTNSIFIIVLSAKVFKLFVFQKNLDFQYSSKPQMPQIQRETSRCKMLMHKKFLKLLLFLITCKFPFKSKQLLAVSMLKLLQSSSSSPTIRRN